jgi:NAD(P)-dependent dehydrogenase (short-subunit alcohol dehydrogenase family)
MNEILASRHFSAELHSRFAALCGDTNPIHVDPIAARRTQAGATVVHGIHAVLWALDMLAFEKHLGDAPLSVEVLFNRFIYVGETAVLVLSRETSKKKRYAVVVDGVSVIAISISVASPVVWADAPSIIADPIPQSPRLLKFAEALDDAGSFLCNGAVGLAQMFPFATASFGEGSVTSVAALSTLVGMVCPGLYSIFANVDVTIEPARNAGTLSYRVDASDDRFALLEIVVHGPGVAGKVSAFVRQEAAGQPSLQILSSHVAAGEFAGVRAVIIGGSRGLGALTARLIAAGGGEAVVTYHVGEADARELVTAIGPNRCSAIAYDARGDAMAQLESLPWDPNQVYYFATPPIFRATASVFSQARFREFIAIYVDGFAALCAALAARSDIPLSVFYPSTISIETRPRNLTEYAMAKVAGEVLCFDLARFSSNLRVLSVRLPRLPTDQTVAIGHIELEDPIEVMLPQVRKMSAPMGQHGSPD